MSNLNSKIAVVTGGNSGIGFSTAQELIARGAKVVITGRRQDALDKAVKELGPNATGILADASNLQHTDNLVKKVKDLYSNVDILFINAGIGHFFPLEGATEQQFDAIMDTNFKGAYFTFTKFVPLLKDGGSVILLSSISATTGMGNSSVYSASKAALNALARVAATELAPRKIRVNTVSPGPIDTPIVDKMGLDAATRDGFVSTITSRVPFKRLGASEEVAKLVAFLAGEDSAFISGTDYIIDGGISNNVVMA